MTDVPNVIRRELTVSAPQERVYAALTDPAQLVQWFPDSVEGSLAPGERPIFDFGSDGKNQVYIEAANPSDYFAFRWVPGSNHFIGDVLTQVTTLVEFRLEQVAEGTKVVLTETGFAALGDTANERFADNNGGWDYMVARLEKLLS